MAGTRTFKGSETASLSWLKTATSPAANQTAGPSSRVPQSLDRTQGDCVRSLGSLHLNTTGNNDRRPLLHIHNYNTPKRGEEGEERREE